MKKECQERNQEFGSEKGENIVRRFKKNSNKNFMWI